MSHASSVSPPDAAAPPAAAPPAAPGEARRDPSELFAATDLLRLLVKAQRAVRLYGANDVARRLESELLACAEAFVERWGPLRLSVTPEQLRLGADSVYASSERGSLTQVLARDGVRRLAILPGLTPQEVHDFLVILNRVAVPSEEEDLVTLLWDRGFRAIAYVAVQEIEEGPAGEALEEMVGPASAGSGDPEGLDPQALLEVAQPVAFLPGAREAQAQEDHEALLAELQAEERLDEPRLVAQLAAELTHLEEGEEPRRALADGVVALLDARVASGSPEVAARLALALGQLAATTFADSPAVRELHERTLAALRDRERLVRLLAALGPASRLAPGEMLELARALGPEVLPTLLLRLSSIGHPDLARAAADAITHAEPAAAAALAAALPEDAELDAAARDQLLTLLELHPELAASAAVGRLLRDPDPDVRLQVAWALGAWREGAVGAAWTTLLADPEPAVYRHALSALAQAGDPALAEPLLASIADAGFERRAAAEKRAAFAALVELVGEAAVPPILERLERRRGWFASAERRETVAAAVDALRALPGDAAARALEELARSPERLVREAIPRAGEEA